MRICIYGAGAIGCWIGARLHEAGVDVSLVARGPHLAAMQANGLVVRESGETKNLSVDARVDVDDLPVPDFTIVTLKSHSIPLVASRLASLARQGSHIVMAVNGIPWWFFYGVGKGFPARIVKSVDPDGSLWNSITPGKAIGCVVYPAVNLIEPGVIEHVSDNRLPIGEPIGEETERLQQLHDILEAAGIKAPMRRDIRNEIWIKLLGNVAFNPLSVLVPKPLDQLATEPATQQRAAELMDECRSVGEKYGARFGMSNIRRMQGAAKVVGHKTSMRQDFERGRTLEVNAILDAIIELADYASVSVPKIEAIRGELLSHI